MEASVGIVGLIAGHKLTASHSVCKFKIWIFPPNALKQLLGGSSDTLLSCHSSSWDLSAAFFFLA